MDQKTQKLYLSGSELAPIHNFFFATTSSIKYAKKINTDMYVSNNSPYKNTVPSHLLAYCEIFATSNPTQEKAYIVNKVLKLWKFANQQFVRKNHL